MRKAPKLTTLIGAGLIFLSGCKGEDPKPIIVERDFRGFTSVMNIINSSRTIGLKDSTGSLSAKDFAPYDGRFDEIALNAPKGHPLEKYANLDSLELAYETIRSEYLAYVGRSHSLIPESLLN